MTKKIKIVLLQFISFTSLFFMSCNSNVYKHSTSHVSSVEIFFNNGSKISGSMNYPVHFNEKHLFIKPKGSGIKKIKSEEVSTVIYKFPNKVESKFFKFTIDGKHISKDTKNEQFFEQIEQGKVSLYYGHNSGFIYTKNKNPKFFQKTDLYFCKKENESNPTLIYAITNNNNGAEFIDIAKSYFEDSQEMKGKIKAENYNPKTIIELVKQYNK
jgi:hypothetical protein